MFPVKGAVNTTTFSGLVPPFSFCVEDGRPRVLQAMGLGACSSYSKDDV